MTVTSLSESRDSVSERQSLGDDVVYGDDTSGHGERDITSGASEDVHRKASTEIETEDLVHSAKDSEKADNNEENSDFCEEDEDKDYPKAPDGGYAWIVCLGSCLLNMLLGGIGRSEGLLFLQFQSRFGMGAQLTAWPGSLLSTLNMFMGPVYGAVCNRFSVRTATIMGALLSAGSLIMNGFAPNVYFLFVSHALIGGLGRGLLASYLMLNLYFDQHRSMATGLAASGVGLGTIWVVPFIQWLFDTYDFQGAFLILSGLPLNCLVCAMIYRPLSLHIQWTRAFTKGKQDGTNAEEGVALTEMIDNQGDNINQSPDNLYNEVTVAAPDKIHQDQLLVSENGFNERTDTLDKKLTELTSDQLEKSSKMCDVIEENGESGSNGICPKTKEAATTATAQTTTTLSLSSPSLTKLTHRRQKENCLKSSLKLIFPVEHRRTKGKKKVDIFHWHLLRNLPFLIFCLSNFLFILSFKACFTFLPVIALAKGLSKSEAALVLTISGAVDTFGRLAAGFILDFRPLRTLRPYIFNAVLFVIAALALLIPFLETFTAYCFVGALYGLSTGAFMSQKVVVLADLLGREVLSSSVGILKWVQAFGTLIGAPLAGALRDALGNYDGSFYMSGASMVGAGLLMVVSNILLKLRKARKSQTRSH